ncbi:hypothetical protein JCM10449v2_002771 [Rhodotorula kratochvilovae]
MERQESTTSLKRTDTPDPDGAVHLDEEKPPAMWWSRRRYTGALLFNVGCFLLPAVYGTLSKMWIANIDASLVATSDTFTYVGIVVEVFNEALPRAVWSTVADYSTRSLASRVSMCRTLIIVQAILGLLLSLAFIGAAESFVAKFVPGPVKDVSVQYVRVLAFGSCLGSTIETAVSTATRALDKPDVPLAISTVKVLVQIILELALISTMHAPGVKPTIIKQATISLVCSLLGTAVGLAYFLTISRRMTRKLDDPLEARPSLRSLQILARPGSFTFVESAVRNAIYLYLVHNVVSMGQDYATAWGVFSTIRWGLIMVPVQALEATSNAFVGHRWGRYLRRLQLAGEGGVTPAGSWRDAYGIARPALLSIIIALIIEVPLCLGLSFGGARPFARYLSASDEVARIVQHMWKTIDWCYIMYAVSTQLATILLATKPSWYLFQSLLANLLYCLPWAIALGEAHVEPEDAWTYHAFVFGGSLVVSFVIIIVVDSLWAWRVKLGRLVKA